MIEEGKQKVGAIHSLDKKPGEWSSFQISETFGMLSF